MFRLLSAEDDEFLPKLPNYLENGLVWLVNKLHTNDTPSLNKVEVPVDVDAENVTVESAEATSDDSK